MVTERPVTTKNLSLENWPQPPAFAMQDFTSSQMPSRRSAIMPAHLRNPSDVIITVRRRNTMLPRQTSRNLNLLHRNNRKNLKLRRSLFQIWKRRIGSSSSRSNVPPLCAIEDINACPIQFFWSLQELSNTTTPRNWWLMMYLNVLTLFHTFLTSWWGRVMNFRLSFAAILVLAFYILNIGLKGFDGSLFTHLGLTLGLFVPSGANGTNMPHSINPNLPARHYYKCFQYLTPPRSRWTGHFSHCVLWKKSTKSFCKGRTDCHSLKLVTIRMFFKKSACVLKHASEEFRTQSIEIKCCSQWKDLNFRREIYECTGKIVMDTFSGWLPILQCMWLLTRYQHVDVLFLIWRKAACKIK